MNIPYKRLIDMNEGEIENLIRRVIREETNASKKEDNNLADQEFLNIKQASQFIKYSVSSLYRKISERAIPFHGKNTEIDHLISLEIDHPFSHQIDHPFLLQTDHPLAGR